MCASLNPASEFSSNENGKGDIIGRCSSLLNPPLFPKAQLTHAYPSVTASLIRTRNEYLLNRLPASCLHVVVTMGVSWHIPDPKDRAEAGWYTIESRPTQEPAHVSTMAVDSDFALI